MSLGYCVTATVLGPDCEFEGGGHVMTCLRWGWEKCYGQKGPHCQACHVSGECVWACAAATARLAREWLAKRRREREACPYHLPLFDR
jgi:hypothetical protein